MSMREGKNLILRRTKKISRCYSNSIPRRGSICPCSNNSQTPFGITTNHTAVSSVGSHSTASGATVRPVAVTISPPKVTVKIRHARPHDTGRDGGPRQFTVARPTRSTLPGLGQPDTRPPRSPSPDRPSIDDPQPVQGAVTRPQQRTRPSGRTARPSSRDS